jgi:hypothetical protein
MSNTTSLEHIEGRYSVDELIAFSPLIAAIKQSGDVIPLSLNSNVISFDAPACDKLLARIVAAVQKEDISFIEELTIQLCYSCFSMNFDGVAVGEKLEHVKWAELEIKDGQLIGR